MKALRAALNDSYSFGASAKVQRVICDTNELQKEQCVCK